MWSSSLVRFRYVEQPIEVIKKVKKQVYAVNLLLHVVQVEPVDPKSQKFDRRNLRQRSPLLVMENNRIKWRIAQRDAEIARLRSQGGVITTSTAPVVRTSGTAVVNRAPVTTTLPTLGTAVPVARPGVALPTTTTTTGGVVTRPATTTVSGVPATSTVRPAGTTTVSGLPDNFPNK
jgi:hypothetical protein